jgi:hypothetical protein
MAFLATKSEAGGRKQLWNVDLLKLIGQAGDTDAEYVWGLALSPDDTKLAIGLDHLAEATTSHVIIVAVDHPKAVLRSFEPM